MQHRVALICIFALVLNIIDVNALLSVNPHGAVGVRGRSKRQWLQQLLSKGPRGGATPLTAVVGYSDSETAAPVDTMNSVDQTWQQLEDFGETLTQYTKDSLFLRAFAGGCFVGFGGILTASVGFDMNGNYPWLPGNGFQRFLSGAIGFPLSILLVSLTGCGAWTGDMLLVARAYFGKRKTVSLQAVLRTGFLTWLGSFLGTIVMAALATGAKLPACLPCLAIAQHKLEYNMLQTFLRGTGGEKYYMSCRAVA
jgi:Formate/nitrite transporter